MFSSTSTFFRSSKFSVEQDSTLWREQENHQPLSIGRLLSQRLLASQRKEWGSQ